MAISVRVPRRPRVHGLLIALTVFAGVLAVMPILGAIFSLAGPSNGSKNALADAPSGLYAIGLRSEGTSDTVLALPTAGGDAIEITHIAHLDGFASTGAVSPSGRLIALITPDSGTPAQPTASLNVVDIETGVTRILGRSLEFRQTPVWDMASESIVVRRSEQFDDGTVNVIFERYSLDGYSRELGRALGVAGAYAVGFDTSGSFIAVVIDGRGSTLTRDMADVTLLSTNITRDWRLSPDSSQLAFVDSDLATGLKYLPRIATLGSDPKGAVASAQAAADVQALGVAWSPDGSAAFGFEPGAGAAGANAQAQVSGFDVPLSYAPDGSVLAVQHWSGSGFADAGTLTLEIDGPNGRLPLTGMTGFLGWTVR